jgi:hypothetical protein
MLLANKTFNIPRQKEGYNITPVESYSYYSFYTYVSDASGLFFFFFFFILLDPFFGFNLANYKYRRFIILLFFCCTDLILLNLIIYIINL